MKLTTNLTVDQAFNVYPYNMILENLKEDWRASTINTFKLAYEQGLDVKHVLLEIEKFCEMNKKAKEITLLVFFHNVYIECLKHNLPDPSHTVPVDLSENRRYYVLKGYQSGIDASIYANNKIGRAHV